MSRSLAKPLAWVEISLANLRHNLRQIKRWVGPKVEVMAIVKADAYGHGMKEIACELYRRGTRFFGVANIQEAGELLGVLPRAKVLVLGSFHKDQLAEYVRLGVRPTISSLEDVRLIERAVLRAKKNHFPIHIKIDTGMGRLGVWHEEAVELFRCLTGLVGATGRSPLEVEGIYTHFASADSSPTATTLQITYFNRAVAAAHALGIHPRYLHAANSMGLAHFKKAHFNLVRPGIMLYGIHPMPHGATGRSPLQGLKLKPVLSLKARITFLKSTPHGRGVSYGSTHRTQKNTMIATLPIGYSHGYRVGLSSKASVLVRGQRCPVVGRVTMDQALVDVGDVPGVKRWDTATLIGGGTKNRVGAEELARILQTIPYEVVCGIHSRLQRFFR